MEKFGVIPPLTVKLCAFFFLLFVAGCSPTRIPPLPEPGYRWTRHLALMNYERAGKVFLKQQLVDINLLDDDTRDGGLLLASQDTRQPRAIVITATNKQYRMQGALLPGARSRVLEGNTATAPTSLRGWLGLQQYLQSHQHQLGTMAAYSHAPTAERWYFHFLRTELYDDALNKPQ